jgi:hypothetical protein
VLSLCGVCGMGHAGVLFRVGAGQEARRLSGIRRPVRLHPRMYDHSSRGAQAQAVVILF